MKANGLVRLRSPGSVGSAGRVSTPMIMLPLPFDDVAAPLAICSNTSASWSPRKIEMIAGGASLAPRRWSLVAEATDTRSSPAYLWTARITAAQNTRNCAFSCGVSPGTSRMPSSELPKREVDVLARPVDARERLLVEQALHAVLLGDRLEDGHQQLLMVGGDVAALEHRRDLELARRDLVVAGLGGDAELEQLTLGVHHEAEHALGDRTEVVVVELLALGRLGAEQGAAGVDQVGTGQEEVPVDQEVLLLGPAERHDLLQVVVTEQLQDALGVRAHRLLAAQQRRLVVQRLAGHRHEHRRDAQGVAVRVLQDVGRAGDVPAGVAAGLEGAAEAAGREAGGVGFALDQGLARELGERLAVADRLEEAVVLLGGQAGHRIEDVRVVRGPLRQRPVLHRRGDRVGDRRIELGALLDGRDHGLEHRLGQPQLHLGLGEDVRTEDLRPAPRWGRS